MLLIVVILLVSFIVLPLIELIANARVQFALRVVVLLVTLIYVLYALYPFHKVVM